MIFLLYTQRKRKKVGLKLEGEEEDETKEQEESEKGAEEEPTVEPEPKEEKKQKKADDLWASFLSDVGQRPKTSTTPTSTSTSQKVTCVAFNNVSFIYVFYDIQFYAKVWAPL